MKYSINGTGNIVAERDIYSLGGFIPKGKVGGKIASEAQLSQDGECWLAGGDISTRPDIVIKDNAYIGTFTPGVNPVHTDGVTEFSGNTLIPGNISVRSFVADTKNNVFIKDSFIGVSMDVLCGSATGTNFPFEPGRYNQDAPKGTLFTSATMKIAAENFVRNTATLCLGRDTYAYTPAGYNARVYWAYVDAAGQLAYAGETEVCSTALYKLSHPVYKVCMIAYALNPTLTPAQLGASGAKILGHVSGSLLMDLRPESASGQYVMDKSSILMNTDNFGLATTQLRRLAGSMYDTNMYTPGGSTNYKAYGTFHNVQRLEYTMPLGDAHKTNVNRDRYISAYDCPLLRIDNTTYNDSLAAEGNLTLRRCIVPKASFTHDVVNGNTYEDIDFSYANEFIRIIVSGRNLYSSHREGLYACESNGELSALISYPGNMDDTARLYQAETYLPLDGNIIEQGAYGAGGVGSYYEAAKSDSPIRIRTGKPLATFGLVFPSLPAGYSVKALYYLDEDFIIRLTAADPTGLDTTYPYVVMLFRKDDDSAINVTDFIALNRTLRIIDHTKVPEITGSAYVGAGCAVRGDVKLIGDPYVNRLLDVNMWERGTASQSVGKSWEDSKAPTAAGNRFRLIDTFPVEPGGLITCNSGYWVECGFFDSNGIFISSPGWGSTSNYVPAGAAYAGIVIKKATSASEPGGLIEDSDIPLANVKYLRAFKKRRYITNELDRTSPEDILLGPDMWEQGGLSIAAVNAGKPYEELKIGSPYRIRLKRPFGVGAGYRVSFSSGYSFGTNYYDAVTKLLYGSTSANMDNALIALAGSITDSPTAPITPADITNARLVLEFVPQPRIIAPYGASGVFITGMKIRMYDNAVLSKNINTPEELILKGDAVVSHLPAGCVCGWGDSDAIVKL